MLKSSWLKPSPYSLFFHTRPPEAGEPGDVGVWMPDYERPEDEVTGNKADDYERRAPGTAGMRDGELASEPQGARVRFWDT